MDNLHLAFWMLYFCLMQMSIAFEGRGEKGTSIFWTTLLRILRRSPKRILRRSLRRSHRRSLRKTLRKTFGRATSRDTGLFVRSNELGGGDG